MKESMNEDTELLERLSREAERRVFSIDVGNLSTKDAEKFIKELSIKYKKRKDSQENSDDR